jgi:GntR family histidine utilization transcriptional repressor
MSDRRIARPGGVARYVEIRQALETAIVAGDWPPGARVPSEQELLERYRCSRMTVNKALSALAASGLIVRRRRSGSFVARPEGEKNLLEIHDTKAEILRDGKSYRLRVVSKAIRKGTKRDAARLGTPDVTRVLATTCVHFADEVPVVAEDRLINLDAVPLAADIDLGATSPGNWLLKEVPWSEAEHHIRAANATDELATLLEIAEGDACLVVERRTRYAGRAITHVLLYYPGTAYQLVARFSPAG